MEKQKFPNINKIVNISKKRKDLIEAEKLRNIDAYASYTCLNECLKILKLNSMPELTQIKKDIRNKLIQLKKITKNER